MKTFAAAIAILGSTIFAGCAAGQTALAPGQGPTIPARVLHIDVRDGYMLVEWSGGRSVIMMDRRALGTYRVGDTVLLDQALRPQGRS